ncbi:MAG TPA: hypothetical protein VIM73_12175, partial [Polyangiaceae bacterium]
ERVRRGLMRALAGAAAGSSVIAGAQASPLAVSAAEATTAAGLAAGKTLSGQVAIWLVAGGLAGSVFSGSAALLDQRSSRPNSEISSVTSQGPVRQAPQSPRAPALTPAVVPDASDAQVAKGEPAPHAPARKSTKTSALGSVSQVAPDLEARSAESDLSRELSVLKEAQRALADGDAAASLALLDRHARNFPNGTLGAERTAARAFALCALGRVEEARTLAREFLRTAPSSPLVPRLRTSCAGAELE